MFIGSDTKNLNSRLPSVQMSFEKKMSACVSVCVCYKFLVFTFYDACEVRPQGYLILLPFSDKLGHSKKKSFQI